MASRKATAITKCRARALAIGEDVDPACLAKAEAKFSAAVEKTEFASYCVSNPPPESNLNAIVNDFINELFGAVAP